MPLPPHERPSPAARAIAERFPTPRGGVDEIFALCSGDGTTLDDLARALSRSPAIAVRFVRLANCSFWGPSGLVTGLGLAVQQLGATATPYAALVLGVAAALGDVRTAQGADAEAWTRRAWTRAVAALTLAKRSNAPYVPEAFACGFLHRIGALALAHARPEAWAELVRQHGAEPALEAQRQAFGCDQLEVAGALLAAWGTPALVQAVLARVAHAGDAAIDVAEELGPLAETVSLAQAIVRLFEEDDKGRALTRIEERARRAFDLPPDTVYDSISQLDGFGREARGLLEAGSGLMTGLRHEPDAGRAASRRGLERSLPPEIEHRRRIPSDPALQDAECGVPSRAAFDLFLDREIQARMSGVVRRPLCVLVLSIEGFPLVHREQGAEQARAWLREASRTLAGRVRRGDLFARLGGSYFGVCMSEANPLAMELLAARLRQAFAAPERVGASQAHTLAVGGACLAKALHPDDGRQLLRTGVRLLKEALSERNGTRLLQAPIAPKRVA